MNYVLYKFIVNLTNRMIRKVKEKKEDKVHEEEEVKEDEQA